jgi:hypothetical protein
MGEHSFEMDHVQGHVGNVSMENKQEFICTTMMICRTSTENMASLPGYAYGSRKF